FDIDRLGGAFTLAALSVPEERFDEVAAILDGLPEVAHNYRREHQWNMWFVLGCATPDGIADTIVRIEALTGLPVLNLPKEETYYVCLHFQVRCGAGPPPDGAHPGRPAPGGHPLGLGRRTAGPQRTRRARPAAPAAGRRRHPPHRRRAQP